MEAGSGEEEWVIFAGAIVTYWIGICDLSSTWYFDFWYKEDVVVSSFHAGTNTLC